MSQGEDRWKFGG